MSESITINGVEYIPAEDRPSAVQIVVLQRGWVVVGRTCIEGDQVVIGDASVIRAWGTTKGLGELVSGPTSKTVLDKAGTVRAHVMTTVLTMDADEAGWAGRL